MGSEGFEGSMPSAASFRIKTNITYFYGAQRFIDHQAIDEAVDDVNEIVVCAFVVFFFLIAHNHTNQLQFY